MKERPILFSAPMVRALLAGTKTVTRRIVNPQPHRTYARQESIGEVNGTPLSVTVGPGWEWRSLYAADDGGHFASALAMQSAYGVAGDQLWVKETHQYLAIGGETIVAYRATCDDDAFMYVHRDGTIEGIKIHQWKPSIFMRRLESRLQLEIVSVRAERLHDITEEDAKAEGAEPTIYERKLYPSKHAATVERKSYRDGFELLWIAINGSQSWTANPWVWVVEFKRVVDAEEQDPISDLIARSSIGAALTDIKARGIDAHLVDLEREMKPKRTRRKR